MSFPEQSLARRVFIPRGNGYRIKTPPPELDKYKALHLVKVPAWLGPEFEFEGTGMPPLELVDSEHSPHYGLRKSWAVVADGSLRGRDSAELKARKAMSTPEFDRALDQLFEASHGWSVSRRTGFHLHVDVGSYTVDELYLLFTMYALLEPAIYTAAGDERSANPFSVPWFKDHLVVIKLLGARFDSRLIGYGIGKYGGLNVESMQRFGTVEWRQRRNTKDQRALVDWINMILLIHSFAKRPGSELVIQDVLKHRSYRSLLQAIYRAHDMPVWDRLVYPELEDEIDGIPYELASELFFSGLRPTHNMVQELLQQAALKQKGKSKVVDWDYIQPERADDLARRLDELIPPPALRPLTRR